MLIDTHCHIQFQGYKDDRDEVIARCVAKNIILNAVGSQKQTSKLAVELSEKYENIYATIGLHPVHLFPTHIDEEESSFVSREEDFDEEYYEELAKSKKVIGVGECGLELFHLPKDKTQVEVLERQSEIFLKQYNFSVKHDLPLIIHIRDAHTEMIELLKTLPRPIKGVVHCYTGDWETAQKYLDMGLYLGFTGIITFPAKKTDPKPQEELLEVLEKMPLDRMLVETDAPYLAPQKYRGKRCEPWMVEEVVEKIAEIREKSVEEVGKITTTNAKNLFTKIN